MAANSRASKWRPIAYLDALRLYDRRATVPEPVFRESCYTYRLLHSMPAQPVPKSTDVLRRVDDASRSARVGQKRLADMLEPAQGWWGVPVWHMLRRFVARVAKRAVQSLPNCCDSVRHAAARYPSTSDVSRSTRIAAAGEATYVCAYDGSNLHTKSKTKEKT